MMNFDDFKTLSYERRSIREFLPTPVPEKDLKEIFEAAQYAPSNCNTQPWQVAVVSGDTAVKVKSALLETIPKLQFQLDFPYDDSAYKDTHKERQKGAAKLVNKATEVDRADPLRQIKFLENNVNFYGAPHAAFVFMHDWCGIREASDVGMYAQNLLLAMRAKNIGSCAQTLLGFNADKVREVLGIEANLKLLFGISFGYFDNTKPLNDIRTERAGIDSAVKFHS